MRWSPSGWQPCFYPNYEYDALRVITACGQDRFLSTGQTVTQEGWKAVYAGEQASGSRRGGKKKRMSPLPDLHPATKGFAVTRRWRRIAPPPKEYNDESILLDMEHAGAAD